MSPGSGFTAFSFVAQYASHTCHAKVAMSRFIQVEMSASPVAAAFVDWSGLSTRVVTADEDGSISRKSRRLLRGNPAGSVHQSLPVKRTA